MAGDTSETTKRQSQAIGTVEILWITAGLGCDGDTIAATAATRPSIEDLVLGAIPLLPKVLLHNPVLAKENGEDFLLPFHRAADGGLDLPFILVLEGSVPNEKIKSEGYWAAFRHGSDNWRAHYHLRMDRPFGS